MVTRLKVAPVAAEFFGTAILVMVAVVLTETTAVSYFVATSVAIALAVVVMLFGSISGAHFNPAITFGIWTARRIGTLRAISYVTAQLLGGLASWQLYQYLVNKPLMAKAVPFNTHLWLAEVIGTFVLAMGVTAAISHAFDTLQAAVIYGTAFFAGIMIAAVASAGFLNPAIALGVRSWSSVYVLGPLVGGLLGVNLYYLLFARPLTARK